MLQTLNQEWGVSIARNVLPNHGTWPLLLLHSPGLAYAFDSDNTGLDSPLAAMQMLTAYGLHEIRQPYEPAPEATDSWVVELDRPDTHDDPRPSRLVPPLPLAPIGPLTRRGQIPAFWQDCARVNNWQCQLLFVAGVDFTTLFDYERPAAIVQAAAEHRVAGATVRVQL